MGQEDVVEPPKKKLKQAQLSFCSTPPHLKNKTGQKRKLNEASENGVQNFKFVRRENGLESEEPKKSNKAISICDDISSEAPTNVLSKNDVNNFNKTECVPSKAVKENKENIIFPEKDLTNASNTEDISFSLCLDIDSVPLVLKEEDRVSDILEKKSEIKEAAAENTSNHEESRLKEDINDSSQGSMDKKDVSLTMDTSVRIIKDSDSDDQDLETTPPMKSNQSPRTPKRKLTPKQLLKKAESEKKQQERERLKQERQAQQAKMKEERLMKLNEKKDEMKKKKEEKEKKRLAEINQKSEEKRMKEEERKKKEEAKEEEKKKKEEAKLLEQRKNSQTRAAFESFFVPRKSNVTPEKLEYEEEKEVVSTKFMPFPVKQDMRLADITRTILNEDGRNKLNELCCESTKETRTGADELYLKEIRSGKHKPKYCEGTWPLSIWQEEQHDVIIVESVGDEVDQKDCTEGGAKKKMCYRAKLLQFHDNRRPPYWGTWRKCSKNISSRRPFSRDNKFFDYEVDSDSEWEDEEEGESLEGGDDADKEQSDEEEGDGENGYLLDNTFVPHGYLSDEEAQAKDEDISPEEQKLRMIILKEEFDEEMNQKAERLKPRLLGCVWISNETSEVSSGSLFEKLLLYRAVWDESSGPINLSAIFGDSPSPSSVPKKLFPQSVVEPLVKLVHGSQLPLSKLVKEFLAQLEKENPTQCVSKGAVTRKIKDIAKRSYDSNGKQSWTVNAAFCSEFGLKDISVAISPNPSPTLTPVGKQKKIQEGLLVSFLKGETPKGIQKGVTKKRAQLITLSNVSPGGVIDLTEETEKLTGEVEKNVPRPNEVVKKRVPFITISKTPETAKHAEIKHKDTPRPAYNPFSHLCKTAPIESTNNPSSDVASDKN